MAAPTPSSEPQISTLQLGHLSVDRRKGKNQSPKQNNFAALSAAEQLNKLGKVAALPVERPLGTCVTKYEHMHSTECRRLFGNFRQSPKFYFMQSAQNSQNPIASPAPVEYNEKDSEDTEGLKF